MLMQSCGRGEQKIEVLWMEDRWVVEEYKVEEQKGRRRGSRGGTKVVMKI